MRRLGYRSPDDGDALAMTFARKVSRKDLATSRRVLKRAKDLDYSVFDVGS